MSQVQNKVVLITGANRGIGKAFLTAFINQGASKVYAGVRNIDSVKPLIDTYGPHKVVPILIDLEKPETIQTAATKASDVDIVINNAGVLNTTSILDAQATESLDYELRVNLYGMLHMAQSFAPVLKNNGGGVFAQVNSVASIKNFPSVATYSASKAAAYSLTQALRESLREQGTLVVSIHPGPIATDMADSAGMVDIAEPPSLVAEALIESIEGGDFHVFPDKMAREMGGAYGSFAKGVVEANMVEA